MSDVMTVRELPIVLVAVTLALGAGFTFAINALLGGTVTEAPSRAVPAERSNAAERSTSFPTEAGNPRIWRSDASRTGRSERRSAARHQNDVQTGASTDAPATPSPPASSTPPSTSPPPVSPAPSTRPDSTPSPGGTGGGDDFYSTG